MEGGAMRGVFTAGVIDVLMENNIKFDGGVGVSAGACFGCNYKSNQPGRVARYNLAFCDEPDYMSFRSMFKTGDLFNVNFAYDKIPNEYDPFDYEEYKRNPMEFYIVATDIEKGTPVYKRLDSIEGENMKWLNASAAMPIAAKIVEIQGRKFLDGGVTDSIPLKFFIHKGYDKNVVILTQPADYEKKSNKLEPIIDKKYKEYPNLIKASKIRHIRYNRSLEYIKEKEKTGECLVIQPKEKLAIGRITHDPALVLDAYMSGRVVGAENLEKVKKYLGEK